MKYLIEKKRKELKSSKLFPLETIQLKEILLKNLILKFNKKFFFNFNLLFQTTIKYLNYFSSPIIFSILQMIPSILYKSLLNLFSILQTYLLSILS